MRPVSSCFRSTLYPIFSSSSFPSMVMPSELLQEVWAIVILSLPSGGASARTGTNEQTTSANAALRTLTGFNKTSPLLTNFDGSHVPVMHEIAALTAGKIAAQLGNVPTTELVDLALRRRI